MANSLRLVSVYDTLRNSLERIRHATNIHSNDTIFGKEVMRLDKSTFWGRFEGLALIFSYNITRETNMKVTRKKKRSPNKEALDC